ncbi:MAG TPA: hypothetical protein VK718_11055 [Ferruginibacter sp.]|jgi:hypothetical protein|nr:hypothetical protein [Ferruginibacter sp.]
MKIFFSIVLIIAGYTSFSQTYVSLAPSLTNTAGTLADKSNIALEIGQQWDVFSMGVDIGQTTLSPIGKKDTGTYLELRPNLNIFQEGRFTNTFTAGIGYVFGAEENLLTEVTYGIEYTSTEQLHFNVFFGNYYYSGKTSASSTSFFGISAAYYFKPNKTGALIKRDDR